VLDPALIRLHPEIVRAACEMKRVEADVDGYNELDARRRRLVSALEAARRVRRAWSAPDVRDVLPEHSASSSANAASRIAQLRHELAAVEAALKERALGFPNVPDPGAPRGGPAASVVLKEAGVERAFAFDPLPHWRIGHELGLWSTRRAARVAGEGFVFWTGVGARIRRALLSYMLDLHVTRHGCVEVAPPVLVRRDTLVGAGHLPPHARGMYVVADADLHLAPSAESALLASSAGETFNEDELPFRLVAHAVSFRREIGSYGNETRGIVRTHQFDDVRIVSVANPSRAESEVERIVSFCEETVRELDLRYRVLDVAMGAMTFASARQRDVEVWAAASRRWLRVGSVSLYGDFQSRRLGVRVRPVGGGPSHFAHTISGSAVALPRLVAALLENGQAANRTVRIPRPLVRYMDGLEAIA
jgi:seryl-tRNA synthetase